MDNKQIVRMTLWLGLPGLILTLDLSPSLSTKYWVNTEGVSGGESGCGRDHATHRGGGPHGCRRLQSPARRDGLVHRRIPAAAGELELVGVCNKIPPSGGKLPFSNAKSRRKPANLKNGGHGETEHEGARQGMRS